MVRVGTAFVAALLFVWSAPGGDLLDAQAIVERSIAANEADWGAEPLYNYSERDDDGKEAKTYEVWMMDGAPYQQLVAINDHPFSPLRQREEQRKMDRAMGERRQESASARDARVAAYERDRDRVHSMMTELTSAFTFTVAGERRVGTRDVYVLDAMPRPGYVPPTLDARALGGMNAQFEIDMTSFEWVRITARLMRPVSVAGLFAQIEPGTEVVIEKLPVGNGVWMLSHFQVRSEAKILLLFNRRTYDDERYFDYRPVDGQR